MDKKKQYAKFLKSFKKNKSTKLMESIMSGFQHLYEANMMNAVVPDGGHRVAITFEIITEESAAQGDAEERGWLNEEGVNVEPDFYDVDDAMEALKVYENPQLGLTNSVDLIEENFKKLPEELRKKAYDLALFKNVADVFEDNAGAEGTESSTGGRPETGMWYTSYKIDSRENLESGNTENRGLHLRGFTPEQEADLYKYLKSRGIVR
jgi:hypothetical protein